MTNIDLDKTDVKLILVALERLGSDVVDTDRVNRIKDGLTNWSNSMEGSDA